MKKDITEFFKEECKKHRLSMNYISDENDSRDTYLIHYRGRSILGVSTRSFYSIPKSARKKYFYPLLKRGLMRAMEDPKHSQQVVINKRLGKLLC